MRHEDQRGCREGASQCVTKHFVTEAIIAHRNWRYKGDFFVISWLHITSLYTGDNCLNFVRKREEFPASAPLSLSFHCADAAPQSNGNPQWPEGDDIILEQLWLT